MSSSLGAGTMRSTSLSSLIRPTLLCLGIFLIGTYTTQHIMALWSKTGPILGALAVAGSTVSAQSIDVSWHAPAKSQVNANFTEVLNGEGKWGFIYDTSETPIDKYGTYNWCNMPHVRKTEYVRPSDDFELKYVELIHRHHKRTPYSSNAFPVESYQWNCDEQGLFYFGERLDGSNSAAKTYWKVYISPVNPFVPAGWIGTCQFPQITAQGLDDSYVHGVDLFGVYHDLLGFLPSRNDPSWHEKVQYRVTNNQITSQVAGLLIKGMYDTTSPQGLSIQASGVDSLEPQYSCPAGSSLFSRIKSGNNPAWANHLRAAAPLYSALDTISGVPASNAGFHNSFDPYYDNLSARQCHDKPLPCRLVNGRNDTSACISQTQADTVFRIGHWEYSQIYRDSPDSLAASTATYGVWAAELAGHLRAAVAGDAAAANAPIYRHNVAHDGSVSRLLSLLQIDHMVWPGMGAEVVFELYQKKTTKKQSGTASSQPAPTVVAPGCSRNNCLRQMIRESASASAFCPGFTAQETATASPLPTWIANCKGDAAAVKSACACVVAPTATVSTTPTAAPTGAAGSESGWYVRVLFGGQVFKSSSPTLGAIDMIPVETLLGYIDGLVGKDASLVRGKCTA
ncbi:hypothetical protein VD0004_g39 [Verticillium dahliae]|nr:histidine phosphatase superfamily [Verticillium dahliae]PNH48411.1 hypothetical protein VD0004_g39 [Verticillium dahliae]PNH57611.1 hypothetical protein VD0003_g262 [Verticillium dahliae]PNH77165.1 hypothetical protein VD0001_g409 [Verticillium dahliae]